MRKSMMASLMSGVLLLSTGLPTYGSAYAAQETTAIPTLEQQEQQAKSSFLESHPNYFPQHSADKSVQKRQAQGGGASKDPQKPNHPQMIPAATYGGQGLASSYYGYSGVSPYVLLDDYAKDEVFIADQGGMLDQYLYVDSSPLRFDLPITRYYGEVDGDGYLKYPYTAMSTGVMPEYAQLLMRVYDVDNDYQGGDVAPEQDILHINGHELAPALTSGNETWSTLTYQVPITYLKFPNVGTLDQAPTPAQNEISIDIDVANGGQITWAVEVDWASLILPAVRPAALVNGILSGEGAWDNFNNFLDLNGFPHEPVGVGGWSSIATNTATLEDELPKVRTKFGVESLNIIAHSKGGLDSRSFIRSNGGIDTLVQLGTPNRGSECATIILGYAAPMTRNLRPDWVFNHFNYTEVNGQWMLNTPEMSTPTYIAAGTAQTDQFCMYYLGGINVRLDPPHDGVVSTDRATLPWNWTGVDNDGIDQGNVNARYVTDHSGLHEQRQIADQAVQWLVANARHGLQGATAQDSAQSTSSAPQTASTTETVAATPDLALIDATTGSLNDAQTVELPVKLSGNTARFQLSFVDGAPLFELVRPDGQVITAANATSLGAAYEQGTGLLHTVRFDITAPQAGTWKLRAKGQGATNLYEMGAAEAAGPSLTVALDKQAIQPGDTATLQATVKDAAGNAVSGAAVQAVVTAPDGQAQTIALQDQGAGQYAAQVNGGADGYYSIRVTADVNGVQRLAPAELAVGGQSATLTGTASDSVLDTNGDGTYEQLNVKVGVKVNQPGRYEVTAELADSEGRHIQTAAGTVDVQAAGDAQAAVSFDGKTIFEHGVNGPFVVKNISLSRQDGIQLGSMSNAINTGAYPYNKFQHARLYLDGNNSDQGVDFDGDGLYDVLRTNISVNSARSGTHWVTARLMTGDGQEVDWYEGYAYLQEGSNQVTLEFDGQKIRRSGYSGPVTVTDLTIQGPAGALIKTNVYQTTPYDFKKFQMIPTDLLLNAEDITVTPEPTVGGQATVQATVHNAGQAGGGFNVEFYQGNPLQGGTLIGTANVDSIAAESTATAQVAWNVPQEPGSYQLYVRLNTDRRVNEYDFNNNEASRSIEVTERRAIDASVTLDPQTLNMKSNGNFVTAYIQLPTEYDPHKINVESLRLNGQVAALIKPTEFGDHNGDGIQDLMVKFDRMQVQQLADSMLETGKQRGLVELELTGTLTDGTNIAAKGTIELMRK
ncbi:MAG: CARDB domain-containing protein [Tumebacillaceae bacterium]